jgi:hypothetical protein
VLKHINEETATALHMRANYIETGDVNLSKHDIADMLAHMRGKGSAWDRDRDQLSTQLVRATNLSAEQVRLVEALREHAARIILD